MAAKAQGDGYNASCGLRRRQTQGSANRAGIDAAGVGRQSRHWCEHREQDRAQRDRASYVHRSQASGSTRCGTSAAYQEGGLTMPNANGHGPKRAILYARVSTDEQARSGYSLAQQLEALRAYATREGYEILEEIEDKGYSGGNLARPGLDRVRDIVADGGVDVVLAQDRDRLARKVVHNGLLEEEFSKHGSKTKALNDYGDDSPEGALMRGIQTQFAEYERAKITERTRRGKVAKARKGQILRSSKPPFGFRYTATGDGLLIHKPEMAVVEKIFRMAAAGLGRHAIQTRLYAEGVPSPKGERVWSRSTLKKILFSDLYIT